MTLPLIISIVTLVGIFLLVGVPLIIYASGLEKKQNRLERHVGANVVPGTSSGSKRLKIRETSSLRRKHIQSALEDTRQEQMSRKTIERKLVQAGFSFGRMEFSLITAGTVLALCFVLLFLGLGLPYAVLIGLIVGLILPRIVVHFVAKRRQAKFLTQFITAIEIVVRGVRSGLPLNDCISLIGEELDEPIKSEFIRVSELSQIGTPLSEALHDMFTRVPLPEVHFFAVVISTQQSIGGNISEALENLANVLRDRRKLKLKVLALTAEPRMSSGLISVLPFVAALGLHFVRPGYLTPLFTTTWGLTILIITLIWMSIGITIIFAMTNLKA